MIFQMFKSDPTTSRFNQRIQWSKETEVEQVGSLTEFLPRKTAFLQPPKE